MDWIQELAKDWHKSEEGHVWHSEHAKRVFQNRPMVDMVCEVCGSRYQTVDTCKNKSRFCSAKCKAKWRRDAKIDNEIRICPVCGKEYSTNKFDSRKLAHENGARYRKKNCPERKVYNLTVAITHEYYANGVLVSNCYDATFVSAVRSSDKAETEPIKETVRYPLMELFPN